jgi:6-phosphofructokinase 1
MLLDSTSDMEPQVIGLRGNRITSSPLMECVTKTHAVAEAIEKKDYETAMSLRGGSFREAFETFITTMRALPHPPQPGQKRLRLAILHSGAPAPGMNSAVRAAVRIGLDRGHIMLGVWNGFTGLIEGNVHQLDWMSVHGYETRGGAELGTNRKVPSGSDFYNIARSIEKYEIDGLLIIGGWSAYQSAYQMLSMRENYPAFNIPVVLLPASISNHLPGSELSIGADTALNNITGAVDKIKDSAIAQKRVFVVEVMGRKCGYLALMGGLATGAERVYIHEEGVTLKDLEKDVESLKTSFRHGKRLGLLIRNEQANEVYTTGFMCALFEEEGKDLFDVRQAILGHLQQGGAPSPFDRIQATRLAKRCIEYLIEQSEMGTSQNAFIGLQGKEIKFHELEDFPRMANLEAQRPKEEWWMDLRQIAAEMSQRRSNNH